MDVSSAHAAPQPQPEGRGRGERQPGGDAGAQQSAQAPSVSSEGPKTVDARGPRNPSDATATANDRPWSWSRFARNAVLVAGLAFLVGFFVVEGAIPHLIPKNFGVVAEGKLYRSGELTTTALRSVVEEHNIKTVIDFGAHDKDPAGERREQRTADLLGVDRHVLYLEGDGTGDPNRYAEALRIMTDPDAQPVLVHCAAGAQRTGCAVALYRSLVEGWDDERALTEALDYRHDPDDNPRMPAMYHEWKDEIERAFEAGGSIDYAPPALPGPTESGAGG